MNGNDTNRLAGYGIALLRAVVGLVFVMHGGQKLFVYGFAGVEQAFAGMGIPLAGVNAVIVPLVEFLGGIALVVGLFTRLAALPLAVTMVVAILAAHLEGGFFAQNNGYEFPLTLLAATAALALTGPGALALDNLLAARRRGARLSSGAARPVRAAA